MPFEINTSISEHRGSPRIWLQGQKLAKMGIQPGDTYERNYIDESTIELSFVDDGEFKVSRKKANTEYLPVIDINSQWLNPLKDQSSLITVYITERSIRIRLHHSHDRNEVRNASFRNAVKSGVLRVAHFLSSDVPFHRDAHRYLPIADVKTSIAFSLSPTESVYDLTDFDPQVPAPLVVESSFLDAYLKQDSHLAVNLVTIDISAEDIDPKSGSMEFGTFYRVLDLISKLNPAAVLFKTDALFLESASASAMTGVLSGLGYDCDFNLSDDGYDCLVTSLSSNLFSDSVQ